VLDIYNLISRIERDDVRWETIEQVKQILTHGAYPVPPEQVAARLIKQMLERGRSSPAESATDEITNP
jgi:anti-sigma28 factor (negative regulator of flagellin synthesis)